MAESIAVVDMLDTIGACAGSIPRGTRRVGAYATGSGGIAWTAADIATLQRDDPQLQLLLRIDQSNSVLSFPFYVVKDVEPGASSNQTAVAEVKSRAAVGLRTGLYTYLANYEGLRQAVNEAGLAEHVDYWVAAWSLSRDGAIAFIEQNPGVVAVQWASPTSNPNTIVPNGTRTLREANIDLSVTRADWPAPLPKPKPKPVKAKRHPIKKVVKKIKPPVPHPKVTAAGLSGAISVAVLAFLTSHGVHLVHLTGPEQSGIALVAALLTAYVKSGA